jgi:hypothetical protein
MNSGSKDPAYDRQLLLEGAKRNAVVDLTEVQRYRRVDSVRNGSSRVDGSVGHVRIHAQV